MHYFQANISRISSTNSIRRPIIKPRNTTFKTKNFSETLLQAKAENHTDATNGVNTNIIINNNNTFNNTAPVFNNNLNENLQLKIPKENSEKPPIYPGTIAVNNILSTGGYALLSQKRKEYLQRTKQNGAIITSPKMSPTSLIMPISANNSNTTSTYNNNNTNNVNSEQSQVQQQQQQQQPIHNLTNINRAQLNSPLQFYPPSNNTSNKVPPKTSTTIITTPINSPNLDFNFNNGIFNYNNLKYTETSYRDYQAKLTNNDTNSTNSGISYSSTINNNTTNTNKFKPNNTDSNVYRYSETNPNPTSNTIDTTQINQYTFTRIPLSPKSTLLKNNAYYNPNEKPASNMNNTNEGIANKRPFSTNGVNSNTGMNITMNANTSSNNVTYSNLDTVLYPSVNGININNQKTNGKFSYLNANGNLNNGNTSNPLQINGQSNQPVQRVLSADSTSRQFKPPNRYFIVVS